MKGLLIATALLLAGITSAWAENEGKPPFQFSSHGTSVLIYQGGKITRPDGNFFKLDRPGSMTCVGPLDCMVTVQGAISSEEVFVCPHVDGNPLHPNLCTSCFFGIGNILVSRLVAPGEHVVQTKAARCNFQGGTIDWWELHYTLHDPNVTQ